MRSPATLKALGAILLIIFGFCSIHFISKPKSLTTIYVITPTYYRITQKPELVRLCSVLTHIPNVHWIVIEDSVNKTE